MKKIILFFVLFINFLIAPACKLDSTHAVDNRYHSGTDSQYSWYTGVNSGVRFAEGSEGFFYLNSDNFLFYMRPADGKYISICAKPECQHEDTNCNAYVKTPAIHYYDEKIYFFQHSTKWDGETITLEYGFYKMDIDGTNRKKIASLPTNAPMGAEEYVIHRGKLYYSLCEWDTEKEEGEVFIYSIDLDGRKQETKILFSEKTKRGQGIYLQAFGNYLSFILKNEEGGCKIFSINIEDGNIATLLTEKNEQVSGTFCGGQYYFIKRPLKIDVDSPVELYRASLDLSVCEKIADGFNGVNIISGDNKYLYAYHQLKGQGNPYLIIFNLEGKILGKISIDDLDIGDSLRVVLPSVNVEGYVFIEAMSSSSNGNIYYFSKDELSKGEVHLKKLYLPRLG